MSCGPAGSCGPAVREESVWISCRWSQGTAARTMWAMRLSRVENNGASSFRSRTSGCSSAGDLATGFLFPGFDFSLLFAGTAFTTSGGNVGFAFLAKVSRKRFFNAHVKPPINTISAMMNNQVPTPEERRRVA